MILASAAGPVTGLFQSLATVVASGVLLGGFAAGLVGVWFLTKHGRELDHHVVAFGYLGGVVALAGLAFDLMVR